MKTNQVAIPSFPTEKYHTYLKTVGGSEDQDLTQEQRQLVFLTVIQDFYDYGLSLDELSRIGEALWTSIRMEREGELAETLLSASELSYYIRHADKENSEFLDFLTDIKHYYEKYKSTLGLYKR